MGRGENQGPTLTFSLKFCPVDPFKVRFQALASFCIRA